MDDLTRIDTIKQLIKEFPDEWSCRAYHEKKRWPDQVCCPHCGSIKIYTLKPSVKGNNYKCAEPLCFKKFNVLSGTIFENTKIPMLEWMKAIYLTTSHKKGISSYQLSRDLGITQKSAWFMLHRIREMMRIKDPAMLDDEVELDEVFMGGSLSNMHKHKAAKYEGMDNKVPVLGILQRSGPLRLIALPNLRAEGLRLAIAQNIMPSANIMTDKYKGYTYLKNEFASHNSVDHGNGEYVRGNIHTNSIEGFFGLLKRGIYGIYHQTSQKHLHRYCDEFSFRYNTRQGKQTERFAQAFRQADTRLRYCDLIQREVKKYE